MAFPGASPAGHNPKDEIGNTMGGTRGSFPISRIILAGVGFGLTMGFLDASVSLVLERSLVPSSLNLFASIFTTATFFSAIYLFFILLSATAKALRFNIHISRVGNSLSLFFGLFYLFMSIDGLLVFNHDFIQWIKIILYFLVSLLSGILAWLVNRREEADSSQNDQVGGSQLGLPWISIVLFVFLYVLIQRLEIASASALFRLVPLLTIGLFIALVTTLVFVFRSHGAGWVKNWSIGLAYLVLAGAVGAFSLQNMAERNNKLELETTTHKIPHIVLITIDTLRADALSCYGSKRHLTPNIDGLAGDAILFEQAIAPSPWTLTTFGSLFTGLSPEAHGAFTPFSRLSDNFETMAEYFQKKGWFTAAVGDNAVLTQSNMDQGFNFYDFYPDPSIGRSLGFKILRRILPTLFRAEASTGFIANRAVAWIDVLKGKDFFFWVHFFDPHLPYKPPAGRLPKSGPPEGMSTVFNKKMKDEITTGRKAPSQDDREWIRQLYDAEVRLVDKAVGRIVNKLKGQNLYDNALVILTSDHGEEFFEHGGLGHGHTLYNELLHVPLIIKLPGTTTARVVPTRTSIQDLLPTLLELCGLKYDSSSMTAQPMTQTILGRQSLEEHPIKASGMLYYAQKEAMIFNDRKYIRRLDHTGQELYDLEIDTRETTSLLADHPGWANEGTDLLNQSAERAKVMADRFGTKASEKVDLRNSTRQKLKSLGYIK